MSATYRIETVADILKVPAERRATMFRELEFALLTHELASSIAEDAGLGPMPLIGMDWTDDGDCSTHINADGKPVFSVAVTKPTPNSHPEPARAAQQAQEGEK